MTVSAASTTILFPCIISKDDPCGIGISRGANGDDISILKNVPIPQGSSLEVMQGNKIVVEAADTVTAKSDVNNTLDVALTIMEIT